MRIWLVLLCVALCGCGTEPDQVQRAPASSAGASPVPPPAAPASYFEDVTRASGIRFAHQQGRFILHLPEINPPGAALLDCDGDGLLDVFFVQGSGPSNGKGPGPIPTSVLYRNAGGLSFEEITREAGVGLQRFGMGCLAADLDNDGYTDLVVAAYREPTAVYLNNGDGTMREAAAELGVQGDNRWNSFVTALDYDRNGLLDLYVGAFVKFGPAEWIAKPHDVRIKESPGEFTPSTLMPNLHTPESKHLYRSRLPLPYEDTTARAGVADPLGRGHAAIGADFDNDGWPDLFVANDASPSGVYRNRGDGTFEDQSRSSWGGEDRGSMGLALSDYQGDGTMDLLITHWIADIPALYSNMVKPGAHRKGIRFLDRGMPAGLEEPGKDYSGWGCAFIDIDRDTWEDLLIINGHTNYRRQGPRGELKPQRALLLRNDGTGHFTLLPPQGPGDPVPRERSGRGAAFGDLDRDGAADVIVCVNNGPAEVWHARPKGGNWIGLQLVGSASSRDGIGARVELGGPRPQLRELVCGESFYSSNARDLLFGLAGHTGAVEARVRWPSGRTETFSRLEPGRFLRLVEGSGWPSRS